MGRVVENTDPLGLGRVRVQMVWQEAGSVKTPWIRVLQPYSGSGKGFYFIPETGEEVLVGFQGGNAEKLYVIGTQYNGKEKSGYADKENNIKAVHTRSGNRLLLNDETGDVSLESQKGRTIAIFHGDGNIEIKVPENISINAGKSINLQAGGNININAGMNISASAGMNYTQIIGMNFVSTVVGNADLFISGTLTELIEGDVHNEVMKGKTTVNNDGGIECFSETTINRNAEKEIQNNSGEKSKLF